MKYIFEQDYLVKKEDCTDSAHMNLSRLQSVLVSAATAQCKKYGMGLDDLIKNGFTWVISKIRIRINKLPKLGDKIKVQTWPIDSGKLVFDRDFAVLYKDETIAKASSRWCVIDIKTRKPVGKKFVFSFDNNEVTDSQISDPFSQRIDNFDLVSEDVHLVSNKEIDINNHLNNARYFEIAQLALDGISPDFSRVREVFVHFKREAVLGEKIGLLVGKNGNTYVVLGAKSENVDIFLFNAKFDDV